MRTAAKTAALMAILTLGSKGLGFLREIFMAGFFGTSYITDAYVMASAIPGILFAGIFTSVSTSYMPIFSQVIEKEGIEEGNRFTGEAMTLMVSIAAVLAALGMLFSDQLISVFALGFSGKTAALTSFYLRILFPTILFSAVVTLLSAYLQYKGIFLLPVLSGYLQSGLLLAAILAGAYFSHYLLPFGLLVGSVLYALAVSLAAAKNGFHYKMTLKVGESARKIILLAVPVFIGSTVSQINTFVDKMLASRLAEGSVSALNYGNLLSGMISALTVTVIVTIIYPKLTQAMAREDNGSFNEFLSKGMTINVLIGLPCSLGAMLYSHEAVQIIFERGAFDTASTALTSSAFFYYSLGLTFIAVNALLIKVYFALQDMKTPVLYGVISAAANITLNLILVGPMAHKGLALATSIAAMLNTLLLYWGIRKKYPHIRMHGGRRKMTRIGAASLLSVGLSYGVYAPLRNLLAMPNMVSLGLAVMAAVLLYLLLLKAFRIEELSMLRDLLRKR